jgi:hypothetical protein
MGRRSQKGYGMTLTDIQTKILKYVAKRKTPVTSKDVQLQTRINRSTAIHSLHFLAKKGYIKSKPCMVNCRKEYFFEFITMEPVPEHPVNRPYKFAKTRITLDPKTFHNPFNLRPS